MSRCLVLRAEFGVLARLIRRTTSSRRPSPTPAPRWRPRSAARESGFPAATGRRCASSGWMHRHAPESNAAGRVPERTTSSSVAVGAMVMAISDTVRAAIATAGGRIRRADDVDRKPARQLPPLRALVVPGLALLVVALLVLYAMVLAALR